MVHRSKRQPTPRFLDISQVAAVLGRSEDEVQRLCKIGMIPAPHYQGRWDAAEVGRHAARMELLRELVLVSPEELAQLLKQDARIDLVERRIEHDRIQWFKTLACAF